MPDDDDKLVTLPASDHWRPEQCLGAAMRHDLKEVVVAGYTDDGQLVLFAGSKTDCMTRRDVLWFAEILRRHALEG